MFDHRKCERCRSEYRPVRQDQSYCSPRCKRAAAYGRERFTAGTKGARKRRLQAPDMAPGMEIAGSVRNGHFSSIETTCLLMSSAEAIAGQGQPSSTRLCARGFFGVKLGRDHELAMCGLAKSLGRLQRLWPQRPLQRCDARVESREEEFVARKSRDDLLAYVMKRLKGTECRSSVILLHKR